MHLLHFYVITIQPVFEMQSIFSGSAGMADNEIRDDLPFDFGLIDFGKIFLGEVLVALYRRLSHQLQNFVGAVFRCQLEPASRVFLGDDRDVAAIPQCHIMTDAAGYKEVLDLGQGGHCIQQADLDFMIEIKIGTDTGKEAGPSFAGIRIVQFAFAAVHIGAGTSEV